MEITRDNLSELSSQPPVGREFTAKKLSNKARAILRGYWLNAVNAAEKKQEMDHDRMTGAYHHNPGRKDFDYEWLRKYQGSCWRSEGYLDEKGYLRKKKK